MPPPLLGQADRLGLIVVNYFVSVVNDTTPLPLTLSTGVIICSARFDLHPWACCGKAGLA